MVRLRALLAALPFLACATAVAQEGNAPPQPKCRDYGPAPVLRICTELDANALSQTGRTAVWRIRVRSGWRPVLVRIHNASPDAVRLEGGNDQIRHMGCVRHRKIEIKVTSVGPGPVLLDATPYDPSPQKESSRIAASLASLLARIEAEFIERRGRLEASPDYSAAAVAQLLDKTEAELLQVLNYQELAALRDYVRKSFQDARAELERAQTDRTSAALPAHPFQVVFASFVQRAASQGKSVPKAAAESVLEEILRKIHHLYELASTNNMVTDLCITSDPESGARFLMRPQSYNRTRETSTANEITGLYRGLYVYSMTKGPKRKECLSPDRGSCGAIDLVDDTRPIFHCDLDHETCDRRSTPLPEGCHGNRP
jgi:hypothetical protein